MSGDSPNRGKPDRLVELENIDSACNEFEAAWQSGAEPQILEYLGDWAEPSRTRLLRELVEIDIDYRSKLQAALDVSRYLSLFPPKDAWLAGILNEHSTHNKATGSQETVAPSGGSSQGSASKAAQPDPGSFADYELLEPLGQGGMGVVYRARQKSLKRIVALKMIARGEFAGPEEIQRFRAEAESAAKLDHPGIVPVYDYGECDGRQYFSMALVEGDCLRERIQRNGPLENKPAAKLVASLALAVDFAHKHGIIHRDLKPSNVLLSSDDSPRITDFGLAKRQAAQSDLTHSGQVLGTPSYMSPEQARGETTIDQRSDIYGLGALLYFVITGRPPFQSATVSQTLHQVCELEPAAPRSLNPAIQKDLETIALKCLNKDPDQRYQSAKDLADDLARFQESKTITARPVSRAAKAMRWSRRNPLAVAIALLVVAGMIVGWLVALDYERRARDMEVLLLQNEIDELTDGNDWVSLNLDAVIEKEQRLQKLSTSAHQDVKDRIADRMADSIDFQMHSLRDDLIANRDDIEKLITRLATRSTDRAESLRIKLDGLLAKPQVVIDFDAEQQDTSELFASFDPADLQRATSVQSLGNVTANLAFDTSDWDLAEPLGVMIDYRPEDSVARSSQADTEDQAKEVAAGYYFLVRGLPRKGEDGKPQPPVRPTDGQVDVLMQLYRGPVLLRQRRVPINAESKQVSLIAEKALQQLKFTFRQGRPGDETLFEFSFDDLFDIGLHRTGVFAVAIPPGSKLLSMHAISQVNTAQVDGAIEEIERANDLIQQKRFQEAADIFLDIAKRSGSKIVRHEFLLRSSLVTPDPEQERQALETITREEGTQFVMPARCRQLLRCIKDDDYASADSTLTTLAADYSKQELATLFPDEDRQQIVDSYLERVKTGGYDVVRRDYKYADQLKLILTIQDVMGGVSDYQLVATKGRMMVLHELKGDLGDALTLCDELVQDFDSLDSDHLSVLIGHRVGILNLLNQAGDGIQDIDRMLAAENPNDQDRSSLYIHKARALAHLNRLSEAQEAIDEFFRIASDETDEQVAWWIDACLVGGFVREMDGDAEGAMELWKSGFAKSKAHGHIVQVYTHSMLGGLCGELDAAEANRILKDVLSDGFGESAIMQFMQRGLMPDEWVLMVLKNIWKTERGHQAAKQIALRELSADRANFIQVLLTGWELYRHQVQQSKDLDPPLSIADNRIIWELMEEGLESYRSGELSEQDLVQETMAHIFPSAPIAWVNIKDRLPVHIRGPMAYIHGCHYAHTAETSLFDKNAAIRMFEQAIADAEASQKTLLKTQAEARLAKLTEE